MNSAMSPETLKHITEATSIMSSGKSGRWERVNARIEALVADPGVGNEWLVQLFASLVSQVFSEYLLLKGSYERKGLGKIRQLAWHARNLLELLVWSAYCVKSREHSRRMYADAGRDLREVLDALERFGKQTNQPDDWFQPSRSARQNLSERAAAEGIDSLDGPYKEVRDAAAECDLADHFRLSFKMLSKFAHPTAMQMFSSPDDAKEAAQADWLFSHGCIFFVAAFGILEDNLNKGGVDTFGAHTTQRKGKA